MTLKWPSYSTYSNLVKRLFDLNQAHGVSLDLKAPQLLCEKLLRPDRAYRTVHIAGTNGKGSVAAKLARSLSNCGARVGVFTSPHLATFRERIQIDNEIITKEEVIDYLPPIFNIIDREGLSATFFEISFMLALTYFKEKFVDYAIIEVGLGGRQDATNVITPVTSVITTISLDHTKVLGNSIEEIAKEKAGIIKPNVPVVIGATVPLQIVKPIAESLKAPLYQVSPLNVPTFDEENRSITDRVLEVLFQQDAGIDLNSRSELKVRPPARFTKTRVPAFFYNQVHTSHTQPHLILDAAHNVAAFKMLFRQLFKEFEHRRFHVIVGFSSDDKAEDCLNVVRSSALDLESLHFVQSKNKQRAVPAETLLTRFGKEDMNGLKGQVYNDGDTQLTLQHVVAEYCNTHDIVVVCGTLYIMGEVREALQIPQEWDVLDLNEPAPKALVSQPAQEQTT